MQNIVNLQLTLVSITPEGESESQTTFSAQCLRQGNTCLLRYDDAENKGPSELVLSPEICEIKRQGETDSRLVFIPKRLQEATYLTPHGALPVSIYTHAVGFQLSPRGGCYRLVYALLMGGQHIGDNKLTITWSNV